VSVTLAPLTRTDFARVAHIRVHPDQIRFSGTVAEAFETDEDGVDFHAILQGRDAVGFFKIDRHYPETYPFARPGELGLRAFIVDAARQGEGLGTAAIRALPAYLRDLYPSAPAVVLSVNYSNPPAIRAYLSGGFADTGEMWPHGSAGPQHIMRLPL